MKQELLQVQQQDRTAAGWQGEDRRKDAVTRVLQDALEEAWRYEHTWKKTKPMIHKLAQRTIARIREIQEADSKLEVKGEVR